MLDLRAFPFTDSQKDEIRTAVNMYYQVSGIQITGGPRLDGEGVMFLGVQISQKQIVNGKVLSEDELISKGAGVFDGRLPDGYKIQIFVSSFEK